MEKYKDIFVIILLLAIVVMVFMVMRSTKNQTKLISAALVGAGGVQENYSNQKSKKLPKSKKDESNQGQQTDQEEEEDDKKIKKPKLKKIHKQILALFKDGQPRTTGEIKKAIMDQGISKDPVEINNSIWNLEPSGTLKKEKIEKTNYWGPGEWFENEMFLEEYAEKIPGYNPEQEEEEQEEEVEGGDDNTDR